MGYVSRRVPRFGRTRFNLTQLGERACPVFQACLLPLDSRSPQILSNATMDGIQLRDEAAQDRVRAAIEFLDPSEFF